MIVFSLSACLAEGEREKGLGMDVELASQEFLCNARVLNGINNTKYKRRFQQEIPRRTVIITAARKLNELPQ